MIYSLIRVLLDVFATSHGDRAKLEAEVLALRRQVQVLEPQIKRAHWTPAIEWSWPRCSTGSHHRRGRIARALRNSAELASIFGEPKIGGLPWPSPTGQTANLSEGARRGGQSAAIQSEPRGQAVSLTEQHKGLYGCF
jgi:hypothetical protein